MSPDATHVPFRSPIELNIDYAKELNPQQYAAVTAPPGPALVIAGAGVGKTRALTYRVAFLVEQGIPPERILLLTFTNKAASEMMRRVSDLLGAPQPNLLGGTFHSVGAKILRRHADHLGFDRNFTILDSEDANHLLSASVADAGLAEKKDLFPKASVLSEILSFSRNTGRAVPEIIAEHYKHLIDFISSIELVRDQYATRKRENNAMDFDDLLVFWRQLLQDKTDIREFYQRQFQFILVDEYQDTNHLQSDIIDLLAARHHNIMVVGDDAQCIYAWRGANFENIYSFPERYPETSIYKIETNYRSTPEILNMANASIAANRNQFAKELSAVRKSGVKPSIIQCANAGQQAIFVAHRIVELHEEGIALENIAVLYRSHFHAMELQMEFSRQNIPFSITSGVRFFEQAHIKDVTAYMRWVCNPREETAFKRMVQMLPGIAAKGADKLWHLVNPQSIATKPSPFQKGLPMPPPSRKSGSLAADLEACAGAIPKKARDLWPQLVETIRQIDTPDMRRKPSLMIQTLLEAGYENHLKTTFDNYRSRLEDLQEMANFSSKFDGLDRFLAELSLLTNADSEDTSDPKSAEGRVRLSTIHQAKGLEFDVVFVIMLCEGLFPSAKSLKNAAQEEEERRLFYVAATRARNELNLVWPAYRATHNNSPTDGYMTASRFLDEIPSNLRDKLVLPGGFY